MVAAANMAEETSPMAPRNSPPSGNISARNLLLPPQSPGSVNTHKNVLIVMDAFKDFSVDPLEWVFKNITLEDCCKIIFLGVMPWLAFPISSRTWMEKIWTMDGEDLLTTKDRCSENDIKCQREKRLADLCQKHGVVPQMRTKMGYLRQIVVEQIRSLHATLVVFDRHHARKNTEYYADKVSCEMIMMNDNGEADSITARSRIDNALSNEVFKGPSFSGKDHMAKMDAVYYGMLANHRTTTMARSMLMNGKRSIAHDLIPRSESPCSYDGPKHVVIVMDALKEFSMETVEWVLMNIAFMSCCTITLLGIMPWLNIPLSKAWRDIWTMDVEDLLTIKEKAEWRSDVKYQKLERLLELCQKYGVVPQIKTEMGYPLHLLVVEQITGYHATLVVFDRHHDRKNIEYYAERVPCNIVRMNDEGEIEVIKGTSHIDNCDGTPTQSTPSPLPAPKMIFSEGLKKKLVPGGAKEKVVRKSRHERRVLLSRDKMR